MYVDMTMKHETDKLRTSSKRKSCTRSFSYMEYLYKVQVLLELAREHFSVLVSFAELQYEYMA